MSYLDTLNEEQKKAVLHTKGPLLVLAGAGAGKTRVITHRILNLIHQGIAPEKILAVTFTNKAAKEMRERVNALLNEDDGINLPISSNARPFVATFHSLGVHILRTHSQLLNVPRHFSIFDRGDSIRAIKAALKDVQIDPKEFEPRKILSAISKQKGEAVSVDVYEQEVGNEFFKKTVARVWRAYEKRLNDGKALDFDDLLLKTLKLLQNHENVRIYYQNIWSHIHIDEYQDTNKVQYELSKILAGTNENICVVGDGDQNIYSWRGANMQNILDFEKRYNDSKTILLEQNYRSTKTILGAANDIIQKNKERIEKNLFTENNKGDAISLIPTLDETHEAETVTTKITELTKKGVQPKEIAVLYRANFQSRALEESFLSKNLPYQVLGVRFFERKEIKDILSFIKVALNPESIVDLTRIINVPPRGIGKTTLMRMIEKKEHELSPALRKRVDDFRTFLSSIETMTREKPLSETIKYIVRASGLEDKLKNGTEDDIERLENIKELVTLATRYNVLSPEEATLKLLEDAALATDQDELKEDRNAVRLMTVHASKGLEFDYVFIAGLEDGLFPHSGDDPNKDSEEERRLFYVALTRARKKIYLLYASTRTIYGSKEINLPSEFITDIPEHFLEYEESDTSSLKTIYLE